MQDKEPTRMDVSTKTAFKAGFGGYFGALTGQFTMAVVAAVIGGGCIYILLSNL